MYRNFTYVLLIFALNGFAQMPVLKHYGVDDGLPSSCIYRVFQDSKGLMWLMTSGGLSRFDGVHFQNFTMADGLPQNDISLAGEDRHQRIWVYVYNNGFCYYDMKNNHFHTIQNPIKTSKVGYINYLVDADKSMIIYTNTNLVYNIDADEKITLLQNGWDLNWALDFPVQRQYPMITGERILYHKNRDSDSSATLLSGKDLAANIKFKGDSLYFHQTALADSALYLINGAYLECYYKNNRTRKLLTQLSPNASSQFTYICVVGGNTRYLFVHTNRDCFIVDEHLNRLQSLDFINKFEVNTVNADLDGNFWICTKEDGVYFLEKTVSKISPVTFNTTTSAKVIEKDAFGNILLGHNSGEISLFSKGVMRKINFDRPINFPVHLIKILSDGRVLVQWRNSFFAILSKEQIYSKKTIKTLSLEFKNTLYSRTMLPSKEILLLTEYPPLKNVAVGIHDEIYLAAFTEIHVLKDSANYHVSVELGKTPINKSITVDEDENIWIGNSVGLLKFIKNSGQSSPNKFTLDSLNLLKKQYPILAQSIHNLVSDTKSRIWIALDLGLLILQKSKLNEWLNVQAIKELASDIVKNIFIDKNDKLWVSSNRGISTIEFNSEDPLQYRFQRLNIKEWLPSQEITALLADSMNLYIGTSRGLTIVDLKILANKSKTIPKPLPIVITSIRINKLDTVLQNEYELSYHQNTIDIGFAALCYQNSKELRYQYRILTPMSPDTTWHDVQDIHKEFAFLEPETYRFYLRVSNNRGDFSTLAEPLVFKIDAPFWRKIWFLSLMTLFIAGSFFTMYHRRIKKIETEAAAKTAMNKRFVELELHGLQAQMNPHFIFNALTAVQSFILHKDTHTANAYLTKFSSLMRQFLEASRRKFISLQDEIDLLTNYVALEQVRFADAFDFTCTVGANIDVGIEIPSMHFQ